MGLPAEVRVIKGSDSGSIVETTVKGRTELKPNEVAMKITHSGVSSQSLHLSLK